MLAGTSASEALAFASACHGAGRAMINDYEGIEPHGARRSDVACLYAVTLDAASGRLVRLEIVPWQLRRFRLGEPDAAARRWLARCFEGSTPGLIADLA